MNLREITHRSNTKNFEHYTGTSYWINLVWKLKLEYLLLALEDWGSGHKVSFQTVAIRGTVAPEFRHVVTTKWYRISKAFF